MGIEPFQPISVKPPSANPVSFAIRCGVDLQLATIAKYLRPAMAELPPGCILDIGAGESPWKEWLPPACRYQGLDVENAGEFGMSGNRDIAFYDGKTIPFPNASFDGGICIEVLEHAEDPDLLVSEIARIFKPGATLLLSVPWSARRHHIPHDYHRFTRERLEQLFRAHGFEHVSIHERGNDICAIANKLTIVSIRLGRSLTIGNFIWRLPMTIGFSALSAGMLLLAHLSLAFDRGAKEDPLGYFCKATKG
ncbi:class I SAM-dependent methyltransferase [Paraburkholderia heleia]|uniref:class I SAM-dependent methyltransferase n=1 Tax=Paraburkholderia heleia TaxID=634127 RepID=UPI0031DDF8A1